jgi:hypothetical protein
MRLDAETMAFLGQCPRRPERLGRKAPLQILGRIETSAMRASNLGLIAREMRRKQRAKIGTNVTFPSAFHSGTLLLEGTP